MISTDRVIVVEGKYDKITLQNVIDAVIIKTDGFGIFKNRDKRELLRRLSKEKGIAVLTDSDAAGQIIRNYIKSFCDTADVINVYVPQIKGKEKRKDEYSKEGFLGVEGMSEEILIKAFERSGVLVKSKPDKSEKVTKQMLYRLGLSGARDASALREKLSEFLDIPKGMSANSFLDAVNTLYKKEEFERQVLLWRQEADRK